jgi:hypothetical protein
MLISYLSSIIIHYQPLSDSSPYIYLSSLNPKSTSVMRSSTTSNTTHDYIIITHYGLIYGYSLLYIYIYILCFEEVRRSIFQYLFSLPLHCWLSSTITPLLLRPKLIDISTSYFTSSSVSSYINSFNILPIPTFPSPLLPYPAHQYDFSHPIKLYILPSLISLYPKIAFQRKCKVSHHSIQTSPSCHSTLTAHLSLFHDFICPLLSLHHWSLQNLITIVIHHHASHYLNHHHSFITIHFMSLS